VPALSAAEGTPMTCARPEACTGNPTTTGHTVRIAAAQRGWALVTFVRPGRSGAQASCYTVYDACARFARHAVVPSFSSQIHLRISCPPFIFSVNLKSM